MRWGLVLAALLSAILVYSQDATPNPLQVPPDPNPVIFAELTASSTTPQLGEPFALTLTIRVPLNQTVVGWPTLDDTFFPLEIVAEEPRTLSQRETELVYTQRFQAVLWSTGTYTTPEARVIYERNGSQFFAPVQSVTLVVEAQIPDPLTAELRPSLSVYDLALPVQGLIVMGVVVLVLLSGLLIRRRRAPQRQVAQGQSALLIIAQLEDIRLSALQPDEMILLAVERLRVYLTEAMKLNAMEMTTSEIIAHLRGQRLMPKNLVVALNTLLEQADLIKFANLSPSINASQFVQVAIRWVKQADQVIVGLYD